MSVLDLLSAPWAILPDRLAELREIYDRHARGENFDLAALEAKRGAPLPGPVKGFDVVDGVAVVPIQGVMSQRMNLMADVSGGVSTELLTTDIKTLTNDSKIKGIVLNIDTPGGAVAGTPELAAAVMAARQVKPVYAFVSGTMASAGYWSGSAAAGIYLSSPVVQVGSIGVVVTHNNRAKQNEALGIEKTEVVAGKYKRIASENGPLTESGYAVLQETVDNIYTIMVGDIAKQRGVTVDKVLNDMADGRVFLGDQAIAAGLADGYSSLEELINRVKQEAKWSPLPSTGSRAKLSTSAAATGPPTLATLPPSNRMSLSEQVAQWAAENPEGAAALRADGAAAERATLASQHEVALVAARAQGAADERSRIAGIRAASLPGHEALVEQFVADGRTTPGEAALAINAAERQTREAAAAANALSAPAAVAFAPAPEREAQSFGGLLTDATNTDALHAAALAHQKQNPGCSYMDAVNAITSWRN